ncbi:MAG: SGNH/GDSL hydrolase family protein [Planctomycetes bacterium]|nr:SGNH/GDSL hydrolase family protein [Planctomycetota bacterium]
MYSKRSGFLVTLSLSLILLLSSPLLAAESTSPRQFKTGDTVCFVGDSITHGGSYHKYINLFYATRFPGVKFETYNCGISGDTSWGIQSRLDHDILTHKPTISSIMLGMNDINIWLYDTNKTTPADIAKQNERIEKYVQNMDTLASRLKAAGSELIFIMPSIYDDTAKLKRHSCVGANDALGKCAQKVRQLAKKYNSPVVDFYNPMKTINLAQQKTNPEFTLVSGDRVHPGDVGHFVMAYEFLRAQNAPQLVSKVVIDTGMPKKVKVENTEISFIKISDETIEFKLHDRALPFPILSHEKKALGLVPFTEQLNQQILQITNLPPAKYEILIAGQVIDTVSEKQLALGINLAENTNTPMYKQALEVAKLNQQRWAKEKDIIRNIIAKEFYAAKQGVDRNDFEAMKAHLLKDLEKNKGKQSYDWIKSGIDSYIENKPNIDKVKKEIAELAAQMYEKNKPVMYDYIIRKKQ